MTRIRTDVTDLLGIALPIVQAGMSWVSSSAALPTAVSRAGGLGVLAAGPLRIEDLRRELAALREGVNSPFAVNVPLQRRELDRALDVLLDSPPPVVIGSQGGTSRYVKDFHAAGSLCLHVVGSVEHATKALRDGADGLIVVGAEAGGHPPPSLVTTLVLVRAVVKAHPGVPVIASGGFVDGHGLAAALALGAGAAQFGTRFLLSEEANVHPAYRRVVLDAAVEDSRVVGKGLGPIRALRNEFTDRMAVLEESGADVSERGDVFHSTSLRLAAVEGDVAGGKIEAGQSAGLVDDVLPAAQIVAGIVADYSRVVAGLPSFEDERRA